MSDRRRIIRVLAAVVGGMVTVTALVLVANLAGRLRGFAGAA